MSLYYNFFPSEKATLVMLGLEIAQIHLICVFVAGFVVSRVIAKSGLAQYAVHSIMARFASTFSRVLLILILTTAFLSIIIPNALAVLAVLPVLNTLRQEVVPGKRDRAGTAFALAVIFGANIGGMGALTGTPANALLLSFGEFSDVPGIESITYANWFLWGIPLALGLSLIGWFVLRTFFPDSSLRFEKSHFSQPKRNRLLQIANRNAMWFIGLATLTSILVNIESTSLIGGWGALGATVAYCIWVLVKTHENRRLLVISDLYDGLPVKGLIFVGIVVVLGLILKYFGVDIWLETVLADVVPVQWGALALCLLFAAVTSFSTEMLSNTVIQLALFVIVHAAASTLPVSELTILMIVTLSSTCAFMSPLATGVNALAFGGVKNVRLSTMLGAGFFMNIICATAIALFCLYVLPY